MKRAKDRYLINRTKYKDIKRKGREIYPYCPWCGQKLKEAEDEQTE